jgi:adenylylsulfate kinase
MPYHPTPGSVVWLTGLSGAGKSTLALALQAELAGQSVAVEILDGDAIRHTFSRGLGFSKQDRDENVRRVAHVAALLARHGVVVLVALISPYRAVRDEVREHFERAAIPFLEVYVNAPLDVCASRDPKGLYRKARLGEIPSFTGLDDPYEPPPSPAIECRTDHEPVETSAARVLQALQYAPRASNTAATVRANI